MKRTKLIMAFAAVTFLTIYGSYSSSSVNAAEAQFEEPIDSATVDVVWTGPTKVTSLRPVPHGLVATIEASTTDLSSCDSGKRIWVPLTHVNYKTYSAGLMMAFASKQTIDVVLEVRPIACAALVKHFTIVDE